MLEGGIELTEPEEHKADYEPGIDYDDTEAVADLSRRQWLTFRLGEYAEAERHLKDQQRHRGRRRPKRMPMRLEAPSYSAV